ncbi:MAG TPA: (deoxy)nucleoside triphosphate pyrophosphohydrolase [Actinomycetes bacterium]|jgi:8-oxo-dGTP diphosphatase
MTLVVGVAIVHEGRLLAARRAPESDSAGGWEFPGGKVEPGETPEEAAVREIHEELGCTIQVAGWFDATVEIGPGLELRVALASLVDGEPTPSPGDHDEIRWLEIGELDTVAWLPADVAFVSELTDRPVPVAD